MLNQSRITQLKSLTAHGKSRSGSVITIFFNKHNVDTISRQAFHVLSIKTIQRLTSFHKSTNLISIDGKTDNSNRTFIKCDKEGMTKVLTKYVEIYYQ